MATELEFIRERFGGEWVDEAGETTCEITIIDKGNDGIISVDVWRPGTGTITYEDVEILPARGISKFGVENDLAVLVNTPGYDLPVAVLFGVAKSAGTDDPDDGGETFLSTLVDALESGYEEAIRVHQEKVIAHRSE